MQIDHIPLERLSVSKANMRGSRKVPDVSDILPSIARRGVLSPLFVRANCQPGYYEIVAGKRRYFASLEAAKEIETPPPLPCIVIGEGDDAEALEVSMIENMLRQNPDQVTQWESYTRLVKEGRSVEDIAATFALTELQVKRVLALGNLLPRIREAFRDEEIDAGTVRHLTLASKAQQKAWLALYDGDDTYAPRGNQLKAWLFGGASISVRAALFDLAAYPGQIVADLFDEDGYFADADMFWTAQNAEIEARSAAYLADGWAGVEIVPPGQYFSSWEYEKTAKRKGGRVFIQCRDNGEVVFHEGYVTRKEAQRRARGADGDGPDGASETKAARPELTSALTTYIDLHRHAALRSELALDPALALRVMVAHAICGSPLWTVRVQDQRSRVEAVAESIENAPAEARFDARRRAVLAMLDFDPERASVVSERYGDNEIVAVTLRLLALDDASVMAVLGVVMAESLAAGTELIETLGQHIALDMAAHWQADQAFLDQLRDREVLLAVLAEVGGEAVASAHAGEKGKVIKGVIADCLAGTGDRAKAEGWVPRWMAFPPSAYTARGGVASVAAHSRAEWMKEQARFDPDLEGDEPDAPEPGESGTAADELAHDDAGVPLAA
ncbi:ParB/RepB/Spo0J family partition protein [Novosphingobium sp.]|uniref:ParB/RepB/Spo0J family partition protein n=1 Tax=Novosphingobium sp. TaxID=1874826 RepID=UPI002733505A|nr:ParB/RepB/Spo0J family partition protein [Novosphingobium sp.]MDP3907537.1 ParB/RepB/Spo0J family partition protein [Novosphingobium sp.]